jgi:3-hexulose-6-phosphate synthase
MSVLLQVALDTKNLDEALRIASIARSNGADIIEAGTILIKSVGIEAIKQLKHVCSDTPILADMKVLDNAMQEVELAVTNGADIVTVSAIANDKSILDAVIAAEKYGAKIMVDFMHVNNVLDRALALCDRGVDYICIHSSTDMISLEDEGSRRSRIDDMRRMVRSIKGSCTVPIAVAGRLDDTCLCELVKAGASIVVVGSYITKAVDTAERVRWLKRFLTYI